MDLWDETADESIRSYGDSAPAIVAGILTCFILIRWRRKCKEEKDKEKALDEVLTGACG